MTNRLSFAVALAALALAAAPACAQTIYKLIAKDGKVTYADKAPKDYDGQVVKLEIDPKANLATLPKLGAPGVTNGVRPMSLPEAKRFDAEVTLKRARDNLENAQKALAAGQEPQEGELDWLGKKGGGARPIPTQAYADRLRALEDAVKAAEQEVERAQKTKRMADID